MAAPTIDALPAAPSRTLGVTEFDSTADTWAAALPGWTQDVNDLGTWMDARAEDAEDAAASAEATAAAVNLAASQAAEGLPLVTGHAGKVLTVASDEASVGWQWAVPAGTVMFFEGEDPPVGALACDGSLVSRTVYARLYAVIGTRYGAGDGSTTFALPDRRGVFLRALDDGAGIDAGRVIGSRQYGTLVAGDFDGALPVGGYSLASGTGTTGAAAVGADAVTGGYPTGFATNTTGGGAGFGVYSPASSPNFFGVMRPTNDALPVCVFY